MKNVQNQMGTRKWEGGTHKGKPGYTQPSGIGYSNKGPGVGKAMFGGKGKSGHLFHTQKG